MPNTLEKSEEEQIRRFAEMLHFEDRAVWDRINATIGSDRRLFHGLELPGTGREELTRLYEVVLVSVESDDYAERVPTAVRAYVDKTRDEVLQLHVFECVFALIRYAINRVAAWTRERIEQWEDTIRHVAEIAEAHHWRSDEGVLCVHWTGDMAFIPFIFPPQNPVD